MKDDYTTNSHYLTYIHFPLGRLGECNAMSGEFKTAGQISKWFQYRAVQPQLFDNFDHNFSIVTKCSINSFAVFRRSYSIWKQSVSHQFDPQCFRCNVSGALHQNNFHGPMAKLGEVSRPERTRPHLSSTLRFECGSCVLNQKASFWLFAWLNASLFYFQTGTLD